MSATHNDVEIIERMKRFDDDDIPTLHLIFRNSTRIEAAPAFSNLDDTVCVHRPRQIGNA